LINERTGTMDTPRRRTRGRPVIEGARRVESAKTTLNGAEQERWEKVLAERGFPAVSEATILRLLILEEADRVARRPALAAAS
jgi:hypothetical protein